MATATPAKKKTATPAKKKPASDGKPDPTAAAAPAEPKTVKWPAKGYSGPPPWELAAEYGDQELIGGEYPQPYTGPGAVTHTKGLLAEGTAGDDVAELARRLAKLGYRDNTITQGRNPGNVLDVTVMRSVNEFQADYGIEESAQGFEGGTVAARELVAHHVGPYTWQALITLTD